MPGTSCPQIIVGQPTLRPAPKITGLSKKIVQGQCSEMLGVYQRADATT